MMDWPSPPLITQLGHAALGGVLIGLSAGLLMLGNGRIAGISGLLAGLFRPGDGATQWQNGAFLLGLPLGVLLFAGPLTLTASPWRLIIAGLLVGIGTRMANGCTSGHGICGLARLSPRSLVATLVFMAAAIITASWGP